MKTMPNSTQEEKYRWIKPILEGEIAIKDMAKICPFSKRALKYWLAAFRKHGLAGLKNRSTRPKTHPRETPIRIKERLIELRKEKKKCALKLRWDLEDEGIKIHHRTIGKILKTEGLTRRYRTRKIHWKYVRIPLKRGELVEVDVKWVPGRIKGQRYFQFTAIDAATRWRYLQAYDDESTVSAIESRIRNLPGSAKQTATFDNGPENQKWEELEERTGLKCFFAHAYHSWERGSNENTNGLIRDYFPKKTDFTAIPDEQIREAEHLLNARPRKRLNYLTPLEVFSKEINQFNIILNPSNVALQD